MKRLAIAVGFLVALAACSSSSDTTDATTSTTAADTTTTMASAVEIPTATEVAETLSQGGLAITFDVTDTTGVGDDAEIDDALVTQAETATDDYDVSIFVFTGCPARGASEELRAANLAESDVPEDALPFMASVGCAEILVELADGFQVFDVEGEVPQVQGILEGTYGPC